MAVSREVAAQPSTICMEHEWLRGRDVFRLASRQRRCSDKDAVLLAERLASWGTAPSDSGSRHGLSAVHRQNKEAHFWGVIDAARAGSGFTV